MIADFATQMVDPPRVRCIGVEMQPFSLGHYLILAAMRNRFVTGEAPLYEDLISAAFVCSNTWEENQKLMRSSWRRWLFLKAWGRLAGKFNIPEQMVAMLTYVLKGKEIPETKKSRGGTREIFADWETRLFTFLRSIGYSESQAINESLQKANLMFCAHLEEAGLMDFKSRGAISREDAMMRILEEEEAKEKGFPA